MKIFSNDRTRVFFCCLILILLVFVVFFQVHHFSFLNYDDDIYVTKNPYVTKGFTWEGFRWAWQADLVYDSPGADYWQPLTIFSRMLDVQLFGMNPAGHHLINLLFHAANAVLIFLFLRGATSAVMTTYESFSVSHVWPSFFAACFFAVHPIQVDPVAWVTARKDVLCTFFGFLSLLFYDSYVKSKVPHPNPLPGGEGKNNDSPRPEGERGVPAFNYWLSALLFAYSLMSKPALLTLPVLLLVLDVWPYRRLIGDGFQRDRFQDKEANLSLWNPSPKAFVKLIAEKWIFFLLAFLSSLTILHGKSEAVQSAFFYLTAVKIPIFYVRYLANVFYPLHLVIRYPDFNLILWMAADSLVLLGGISYLSLKCFKNYPYLLAGWSWCLLILLPSVGLDFENRYMYVPIVGLALIVCWGTLSVFEKFKLSKWVWALLLSTLVAICALLSWLATGYWQDSHKLFGEVLRVNEKNPRARNNYATSLAEMGRLDEAISEYTKAIWEWPDYSEAHNNLGVALMRQGKNGVARTHLSIALQIKPDYDKAHNNMSILLSRTGNVDGAIWEARESIRLSPELLEGHFNLAIALADKGLYDEAVSHLHFILNKNPKDVEALSALGVTLDKKGSYAEAERYQLEAIRLDPNFEEARNSLGNTYLHMGRMEDALREFRRAIAIAPDYAEAHNNLAVLLANLGQKTEAVKHFNQALRANPDYGAAKSNLRLALSKEK